MQSIQHSEGLTLEQLIINTDKHLSNRLTETHHDSSRAQNKTSPKSNLFLAAQHCTLAKMAKRVRPKLVYHFANALHNQSTGQILKQGFSVEGQKALISIATAAELIHSASLVHDDVIDEGTIRRGKPTVNAQWDNITSVLTGDLMFSIAFSELTSFRTSIIASAVDVLKTMSIAVIEEVHARANPYLTLEQWRQIASGKTGVLFAWCGSATAEYFENFEAAKAFEKSGLHIGIAFQLADDLKDLMISDGKDRFADIRNKSPSYPLIWARENAPKCFEKLVKIWQEEETSEAEILKTGQLLLDAGAIQSCYIELLAEVNRAKSALDIYKNTAGGQAIVQWADHMLNDIQNLGAL